MRVVCTTQDSTEWFDARVGKVTASRIADAMARYKVNAKGGNKGDFNKSHWDYVSELAWGMITKVPAEHHVTREMELGKQFEPMARAEYMYRYDADVTRTGFVLHPALDYLGSSPDGLVGADGGVEIKVPKVRTHQETIEADAIPEEYKPQMYCNMLCCQRDWWDFVSFCPCSEEFGAEALHMPDELRMFRKRLFADKKVFAEIEEIAGVTIDQALAKVHKILAMYPSKSAPKSKTTVEFEMSHEALAASEMGDDPMSPGYAFLDEKQLERVP